MYFDLLEEYDLEVVGVVNHPIVRVRSPTVGAKHNAAKNGEALHTQRWRRKWFQCSLKHLHLL